MPTVTVLRGLPGSGKSRETIVRMNTTLGKSIDQGVPAFWNLDETVVAS